MNSTKKLTLSAIVIALYVIIMFLTQSFAFMQFQIRIATSLYSLSYMFPFLILPLGFANLLSNLIMGGLGPIDAIGGIFAGILTSSLVFMVKKYNLNTYLVALPIIFIPGLLVPVWLSYLLNLPYSMLAVSVIVGQVIPGIVGVIMVKHLKIIWKIDLP